GLEALDGLDQVDAVPGHRTRRALGLAVLLVRERGLRDHRADPRVVGDVGQVRELLVGQLQLLAQGPETTTDRSEAALEQERHPLRVGTGRPRSAHRYRRTARADRLDR